MSSSPDPIQPTTVTISSDSSGKTAMQVMDSTPAPAFSPPSSSASPDHIKSGSGSSDNGEGGTRNEENFESYGDNDDVAEYDSVER